ncbi:MAG: penicillin-insensitive murein endopeptidase [Gammaproteobacteria bacterium]
MNKLSILLLLLSVSSFSDAKSVASQWARIEQPNRTDQALSIGDYTAGCLSGAVKLPVDGEGYQVMRLSRKRYYGHPDLIRFIEKMGQNAAERGWGALLIGDLGQPRGGPTLSGHRSHQTGLDVDIWYLLSKKALKRSLTAKEREHWNAPSMVTPHTGKINGSNWSPVHEHILETAARMPEVDRIFVNPEIKRWLCEHRTERDWLIKLRPWWGHDDHFHVRLKCPANSLDCLSQEPVPAGDGCDASLAWWFTDEARAPKVPKGPVTEPLLPVQCKKLLKE